jgi:hypothetical protein
LIPEQSTAAIIVHHKDAKYYSVGESRVEQLMKSWDEYNFFRYASESFAAYQNLFQPNFQPAFTDPTLRYYGAWFLMAILFAGRLFPNWYISEAAHLLTFIAFLFGVFIFYLLARRWLGRWSAFGAASLFALQPVLWGHGFINARDIPFMVGFLATIHFGLRWSDSLTVADFPSVKQEPVHGSALMRSDWDGISRMRRFVLILLAVIGFIGFALLLPDLGTAWSARAVSLADTSSAERAGCLPAPDPWDILDGGCLSGADIALACPAFFTCRASPSSSFMGG